MFKINLSLKVLSVFVIGGIIGATLVGMMVYHVLIGNALNEVNHFHKIITHQTLDKIDRHIRSSILNIQSASKEYMFQELLLNNNQNNSNYAYLRLAELLSLSGPWNMLVLANSDGKYVVTSHRTRSLLKLDDDANQAYVLQALTSHDLYVSDLVFSPKTGGLTMIIAAKIIDEKHPKHRTLGVLVGHLAWPVIQEILLSNLPSNSHFYLYNKNKRLIASTDTDVPNSIFNTSSNDLAAFSHHFINSGESIVSDSKHKHATVISNISKELGYLDYAGNDWLLAIEIKESIVLRSAIVESTNLALMVSLLVVLVSLIPAIYVQRRVSRPIIELSNTLALESRQEHFSALFKPRNDEIGLLYDSIGTMLSTIEKDKNKLVLSRDELQEIVAEQTLSIKSSEERIRIIFGSSLDAIITTDEEGNLVEINPAAERIFGLSNDDICGKELAELIVPTYLREEYHAELNRYRETENHHFLNHRFELNLIRADGKEFPAEISVVSYKVGGRPFITGFLRDITERKLQEEQLRRSQKMDALGILTGGVAHDYNNMLGVILGFAELLTNELSTQPKLQKYANHILHAGKRGTQLTKTLLSFSRQKQSINTVLKLNTLLQNEQHLLEKTLTARVNLVLELGDDVWPIFLNSGDLEDAIINMSINAMHAIEDNGQITLKTENKNINKQAGRMLNLEPGDYVLLSIIDNGCGMDNGIIDNIFDPFFSTKDDKGTGLGLSQVYGFVKRSHGAIQVSSKPGQGSRFDLYFPRSHQTGTGSKPNKPLRMQNLKGTETLLVVDDEPALTTLAKVMLKAQGYHVFTAGNGKQALAVLEKELIDLVISDVIMPDMDGYQLASLVQQKYPHIKIQMVSGFADNHLHNMVDSEIHQKRLKKPYTENALLLRVRNLLDENIANN